VPEAARIRIRVSAGARRPGVVGRYGEGWKVRVAAPAEDGRANAELRRHLADALGVRLTQVRIVAGPGARDKVIAIEGLTAAEVERRLDA
jgi:uncharacterized protein